MKKFFFLSLLIFFFYSCVSQKSYEDNGFNHKQIKELTNKKNKLSKESKSLRVRMKDLAFKLQMCEIKLRRQDRKLVECLDTREEK